MGKTFESSYNVCSFWSGLSYHASCSLAYWGSFVGLGICIVLSGKAFKTKSGKGTLLTKFIQNFSENTLSSYSLVSFYSILAKSFCPNLMELDTPMVFWQSVVGAKLVLAIIAFKRQVLFFTAIRTIKLHKIIKNSY